MYFVVDIHNNNFNNGTHMPINIISDLNTDMIFTIMFQRCDKSILSVTLKQLEGHARDHIEHNK